MTERATISGNGPDREETMQTQPQQLLAFVLDGDRYCADLERVAEVVENHGVTPLPNSSPEVLGVTDLRGETMRVLDPRGPLGRDGGSEGDRTASGDRIVVTRPGDAPVGWLVDAVEDVVEADAVDVAPADGSGADGGDEESAADDAEDGIPLVDLAAHAEGRTGGAIPAPAAAGPTMLLEFALDGDRFAVPLDAVAEIADAGGMESVEDAAAATVGKLSAGDRSVLVTCPKTAYDLGGEPTGDRVIVLDRPADDDRRAGWLVDEVFDVFEPDEAAVEAPGPDVAGVDAVVHLEDRFVMWLQPTAATEPS